MVSVLSNSVHVCVCVCDSEAFQSSSDESGDSTLSGLACACMLAHSGGWCVPCSVEQWCEGCGWSDAGMPAPCCVLPPLPTRPGCMWWRLSSPDMTTDSQWRRCSGSQGGAECQRRVVSLTHVGAEDVVWFKGSH